MVLENSSRTLHLTVRSLIAAKWAELSGAYFGFMPPMLPPKLLAFRALLYGSPIRCGPHALLDVGHGSSSSYTSGEWKSISVPIRQVISLTAYQKGTETNMTASQAARSIRLQQDLCVISCLKIKQRELLFNSPVLSLWA